MTDENVSDMRVRCPFLQCEAMVRIIEGRGPTSDTPHRKIYMFAQHVVEPGSWFGLCPASLMPWPIETTDRPAAYRGVLDEASVHYANQEQDRGSRRRQELFERGENPVAGNRGQHPLAPKPTPGKNYWLRPGEENGDDGKGPRNRGSFE